MVKIHQTSRRTMSEILRQCNRYELNEIFVKENFKDLLPVLFSCSFGIDEYIRDRFRYTTPLNLMIIINNSSRP